MTRTVVITGSTKGLGYGYARELLKRGHRVVISGRGAASVAHAVQRLQGEHSEWSTRMHSVPCDVGELRQVQALWDAAVERLGAVDIWINNAGFARSGPTLLELTPEEMAVMVRSNLIGSIHGTQVALKGMKAIGRGQIVNTLGGGAKGQVVPGMIAYSTTKRAVKYVTECLRKELGDAAIVVTTVSPGVNITEGMLREIARLPPEQRQRTVRPLNIVGDHVESTTPWLVDRILADRTGQDISWLTGRKLLKRFLLAPFRSRALLDDHSL